MDKTILDTSSDESDDSDKAVPMTVGFINDAQTMGSKINLEQQKKTTGIPRTMALPKGRTKADDFL